jgi:catechol 2,3-dioxygenase-like lactoylglutathione lyase family enzyme
MPEHLDQARIGAVMGGGFRRAHLMRRVRSGDDWRYPVFDSAPIKATLPASDIERARDWYKATLGLDPTETDDFGGMTYHAGGVEFLLYPSEFAGTNKATAASITAVDFDSAVALLRSRGVAFQDIDYGEVRTEDGVLAMPDGRRVAWFTDSEGNIIALTSG